MYFIETMKIDANEQKYFKKLYFVGFLFPWFKWTMKSTKIRTPWLIIISQYITVRISYIWWDDDDIHFVSDQYA
jgi:hypothetical protein